MKFDVFITSMEHYRLKIEADNELEAIDSAFEPLETEKGKAKYHDDSSGTEIAHEIS